MWRLRAAPAAPLLLLAAAAAAAGATAGSVRAYAESCYSIGQPTAAATRASLSLTCPRLGHKLDAIILSTAARGGAGACARDTCETSTRPNCGMAQNCLGKASCSVSQNRAERLMTGSCTNGFNNYHVLVACRSLDPRDSGCLGNLACFASDFAASNLAANDRFSATGSKDPFQTPGKWLYRAVRANDQTSLNRGTPCRIEDGSGNPAANFGPYLHCDWSSIGGAAAVPPATCMRHGGYLLFPDSEKWRDVELSFNFFVNAPAASSSGVFGVVFRYQDEADHLVWAWGGNSATGCSGMYRRRAGAWTVSQFGVNKTTEEAYAAGDYARDETGTRTFQGITGRVWHTARITLSTSQRRIDGMQRNVLRAEVLMDREGDNNRRPSALISESFTDEPATRGALGLYMSRIDVWLQDITVRHGTQQLDDATCGTETPARCSKSDFEDCINCSADCPLPCGCGDDFCESDAEAVGCSRDCGIEAYLGRERPSGWDDSNFRDACPLKQLKDGRLDTPSPLGSRHGSFAGFWSFDNERAPLLDDSARGMHLRLRGQNDTLRPESFHTTDCGIPFTANGMSRDASKKRNGGCFQTISDTAANGRKRDIVLVATAAKFGVLPINACSYSVAFWAKVTSDGGADSFIVQWGSTAPTRPNQRLTIAASRARNVLVHRWGAKLIEAPVPWSDGKFHHIVVTYSNQKDVHNVWVDTKVAKTEASPCGAVKTIAHLTYGEFIVGRFNGVLDDLKIIVREWPDGAVFADAIAGGFEKVQPTPATMQSGPVPPSPLTPFPTPPPPPAPTPAPPLPPIPRSACHSFGECYTCLARRNNCHWCSGDEPAKCLPLNEPCAGGEPSGVCKPDNVVEVGVPCDWGPAPDFVVRRYDLCGDCGGDNTGCTVDGLPGGAPPRLAAAAAAATATLLATAATAALLLLQLQ